MGRVFEKISVVVQTSALRDREQTFHRLIDKLKPLALK
jgi:hypothetical protein